MTQRTTVLAKHPWYPRCIDVHDTVALDIPGAVATAVDSMVHVARDDGRDPASRWPWRDRCLRRSSSPQSPAEFLKSQPQMSSRWSPKPLGPLWARNTTVSCGHWSTSEHKEIGRLLHGGDSPSVAQEAGEGQWAAHRVRGVRR